MPNWLKGEIVENHQWNERLFSLRIKAPFPEFRAGQFARVAREIGGELVARPYSLVNTPDEELLEIYWTNIDPLVPNQQFCDGGSQYRSAIFYHGQKQKMAAEASLAALGETGRITGQIFTQIAAASTFYPAEDYHQDYYHHNPIRYKIYRYNCGRDRRLKDIWGEDAGGHHG